MDELTDVQRVCLLALRLRALDARSADPLLGDTAALDVARAAGLDLDSPRVARSMVLVHAVRARMLDAIVTRFVTEHPTAVVLDLGAGLDTRRHRHALPAGVDWYDVDFPAVVKLREQLVPGEGAMIAADLTEPGWLDGLPSDRPALAVSDGLQSLLTGPEFIALTGMLTGHFDHGEFAFNAYSRLALRNARRMPADKASFSTPAVGEGIDDPAEVQTWGTGLTLVEEQFMADAPEVARWPAIWRLTARLTARSTRLARTADRVLRYRF